MGLIRRMLCVVTGHDFFSLGYYDDIEWAGQPSPFTASDNAVFEALKCRCCGKETYEFRSWGSTEDPAVMKNLRYVDRGEDP